MSVIGYKVYEPAGYLGLNDPIDLVKRISMTKLHNSIVDHASTGSYVMYSNSSANHR